MTGISNMLADLSDNSVQLLTVSSDILIRMGVLLGLGWVIAIFLSFFVRNLRFKSALLGGTVSGALAAGGYLFSTSQFNEIIAYLIAAALLVLGMTLMVAHARPCPAKADKKESAATSQSATAPAPAASQAAPKADPKPDPKPDPAPVAMSSSTPAPEKKAAPEPAEKPESKPATPTVTGKKAAPSPISHTVTKNDTATPPTKDTAPKAAPKATPKATGKPSGTPMGQPKSSSGSPAWMQDH